MCSIKCLKVIDQLCSNDGPMVQNGPAKGVLSLTLEIHRKILKNLLLENQLAQSLESWYVALPRGLRSKIALEQGVWVQK